MRGGVAATGVIAVTLFGAARADAGRFKKGPYLQNVSQSSVTLMWESDAPRAAVVEVATTPPRRIEVTADEIQEVLVGELEAGRRYRYAVAIGDERIQGEFATAPPPGAPFSFIVFGDSRSTAPGAHRRVVDRVRDEVPDFILGTGDIVTEGQSASDWQMFFDVERDLLRENVLYPSLGNHDRQGRGRTADNYRRYFALPENSPDPERYYAFTYGSARFLILDSNSHSFALTDQTEWIEQQLQASRLDAEIRHIFVTMHHPPYSVSLHGGQEELREAWTPLFEKYQVAAVFSGHDHVYSRAEKNGVHYFVSGGGGAPLYPRKPRSARQDVEAVQFFERVNHYLKIHVFGDLVEVTGIRADGTIIETATWGSPPARGAVVARAGSVPPADRAAADQALAAATGAGEVANAEPDAAGRRGGGFGVFGILGMAAVVIAAAGMVWTLRR